LQSRTHTIEKVENGLKTFTMGLGLKVILANQIGGLWGDISMIGYESISTPLAWLGIIAYSFQIYFDFWGYSLMAIGLGEILGFQLPKNFDHPYTSVSMTEFWRRWHMTLGQWFKDYIYFPLGGSRTTIMKTVRNSFIVWAFTGLWHGASWNFIIWGLVLFAILMLEKFAGVKKFMEKYRFAGHVYMILLIPLTWLLFAITDFSQLGEYFKRLINISSENGVVFEKDYIKYWGIYGKYFIAGILFSTKLPEFVYKKIKDSFMCVIILLAVFWFSVYCMYQGMDDPFLYFRF
ncbi:MAG: MBOAT family protein, partial [Ruminococcus sp.]|nr:MBOAT family protein [Ruminococcus sp.]